MAQERLAQVGGELFQRRDADIDGLVLKRDEGLLNAKPSQALKELQDSERDSVLRFGPENPRAALEASVLRLPRAFADFAAARRELHAFALARAAGALDAAEARRILEGASTGARLDDARRVSSSLEHASDLPAAVAGLSVDDAVERLRRGSAPMVG